MCWSALASHVCAAAMQSPGAPACRPARPARQGRPRLGQLAHDPGRHQHGGLARHLVHGRPRRGDERSTTGECFEGREPESFLQRRVGDGRRRPQQCRHRLVRDVPGTNDAPAEARPLDGPVDVGDAPPGPPRQHQDSPAWSTPPHDRTRRRGRARPSAAPASRRTARRAAPPQPGIVLGRPVSPVVGSGRGPLGPEPVVVDAVGHDEHPARGPRTAAQSLCGPSAHAHDGVGPASGHGGWPARRPRPCSARATRDGRGT